MLPRSVESSLLISCQRSMQKFLQRKGYRIVMATKKFIPSIIFCCIITLLVENCEGALEFCEISSPKQTVYYSLGSNCKYGILFNRPVFTTCVESSDDKSEFIENVCTNKKWHLNKDGTPVNVSSNSLLVIVRKRIKYYFSTDAVFTNVLAPVYTIHFYSMERNCSLNSEENRDKKCRGKRVEIGQSNLTPPPEGLFLSKQKQPQSSYNTPHQLPPNEMYSKLYNRKSPDSLQTLRMIKYIVGLLEDKYDDGPDLRIMKLLAQCFQIMIRFCDKKFVPIPFYNDVQKGFKFLFKESEISKVRDISITQYNSIKKALDDCLKKKSPFKFVGELCPTTSKITKIRKNKSDYDYDPDVFWQDYTKPKFDIVVETTWSVTDFVHGLCYGTFRDHVNDHHLFHQAVERLFTNEIVERWFNPTVFRNQDLWDNVLSTHVNSAIDNLGACIQAAYIGSPFVKRLDKKLPLYYSYYSMSNSPSALNLQEDREDPSLFVPESLEHAGLQGAGWCFQSEQEKKKILQQYKKANCKTEQISDEIEMMDNAYEYPDVTP